MVMEELAKIVGAENVIDDPGTLDAHSKDESFVPSRRPCLVVKPSSAKEVQDIVKWANQTGAPLVPVSSAAPHFRGDTVPTLGGAVIVDLTAMKRIIRIDRRNRVAIVEPGVTFGELQPELAKQGLRLPMPLHPRGSKSVVGSFLEREPHLIPKYSWDISDPLLCVEVVWGNGEMLITGEAGEHGPLEEQWKRNQAQLSPDGPHQVDYYRLLQAAQGSMGIVTWASLRCELLPQLKKLFFVPSAVLDDLLGFAYKMLRFRYGDELLILNNSNLASILGKGADQIPALAETLPHWVLILCIAGYDRLPRERVEFQEKDVLEIAQQFGLKLVPAIPGAGEREVLEALQRPSNDPYWKLRYKGGCQEIFFLTTLNRTPEFIRTMYSLAEAWRYTTADIGIYIQPVRQGVGCHCEFDLPFDPGNPREVAKVKGLLTETSEALVKQGAFFSRPYGAWADLAYRKDAETTIALRKVKRIFDPNNVMNPGKLCF